MKHTSFYYLCIFTLVGISGFTSCNKDETIDVEIPEENEGGGFRPTSPSSTFYIDKVYEYTPAPGQYINDFGTEFSDSEEISALAAAEWAFNRLGKHNYVSLGAFGGYIIVGFDHSIKNTGNYEIGVFGNAFSSENGSSNEPGIVYVMQDENKNGLPDDTWYELKGSDTFARGTIYEYEVTYYKPTSEGKPIQWTDNLGNQGEIPYMGIFHKQSTYYPRWITANQYTLSGTCLKAKTLQNPETGNWDNPPFEWGYVDNMGYDNIAFGEFTNCNRFKISDAIDITRESVDLDYIDFVKIQTGVSAVAGWLGEVSTEIFGIVDLSF